VQDFIFIIVFIQFSGNSFEFYSLLVLDKMFISLNMFTFQVYCSNWGTCKMGNAGEVGNSKVWRKLSGYTPQFRRMNAPWVCCCIFICCIFIYLFHFAASYVEKYTIYQ